MGIESFIALALSVVIFSWVLICCGRLESVTSIVYVHPMIRIDLQNYRKLLCPDNGIISLVVVIFVHTCLPVYFSLFLRCGRSRRTCWRVWRHYATISSLPAVRCYSAWSVMLCIDSNKVYTPLSVREQSSAPFQTNEKNCTAHLVKLLLSHSQIYSDQRFKLSSLLLSVRIPLFHSFVCPYSTVRPTLVLSFPTRSLVAGHTAIIAVLVFMRGTVVSAQVARYQWRECGFLTCPWKHFSAIWRWVSHCLEVCSFHYIGPPSCYPGSFAFRTSQHF